MSEHTEGKIEAFTEESFSGWFALRQITDDGLNHEIGSGDGGLFEPDARRLAACWNTMDGLRTQDIEQWNAKEYGRLVTEWANGKEKLASANERIAKLEALVAERDAMLGKRPCQNSRCNELNAARALMREIYQDGNMDMGDQVSKELDARLGSYLDACDTLEGK